MLSRNPQNFSKSTRQLSPNRARPIPNRRWLSSSKSRLMEELLKGRLEKIFALKTWLECSRVSFSRSPSSTPVWWSFKGKWLKSISKSIITQNRPNKLQQTVKILIDPTLKTVFSMDQTVSQLNLSKGQLRRLNQKIRLIWTVLNISPKRSRNSVKIWLIQKIRRGILSLRKNTTESF